MGDTVLHATMSVDGFAAGPEIGPDAPMGIGGRRLHDWIFHGDATDQAALAAANAAVGATVIGRRTFDIGVDVWGDVPYPVPSFVLTHRAREPLPMTGGAFTFVTTGLTDAVARAHAAAGGKDVVLMGADLWHQALRAGLVDVLNLQVAPVLLGAGTRLFDILPASVELTVEGARTSANAIHLRYRVRRA